MPVPFDNVEGAHKYVGLLSEAVRQARDEVAQDLAEAQAEKAPSGGSRRSRSFRGSSSGSRGSSFASRHLLNDLRRLRRLLVGKVGPSGVRSRATTPTALGVRSYSRRTAARP